MTSALRGGGGVSPKEDVVREVLREFSTVDQSQMGTRGGGGQKIPKFCGRHLWMAPYPS